MDFVLRQGAQEARSFEGKIVSDMVEKQAGEEAWGWARMERVMLMTERQWIDHLEREKLFWEPHNLDVI